MTTECLKFSPLCNFQGVLGQQLAQLHLRNIQMIHQRDAEAIHSFGFEITVCCGEIPLNNTWNNDWLDFYCNQRLKCQVELANRKYGCQKIVHLWSQLESNIKNLFKNTTVLPSLLHGDLWSGNAGETDNEPVVFDPASFYGHHEFDLSIARMFGGFNAEFFEVYHWLIPPEPGFDERIPLYELFHYLNHWNHFGGSYQDDSFNVMRKLIKLCNTI